MLRDKSLIPLSHQHQRALALCVRLDRASPIPDGDLEAWQSEVALHYQQEIRLHFEAEESVLFPAARKFAELGSLVEELLAEHSALRDKCSQAETRAMSAKDLLAFSQQLSAHIRKEERHLFERLQKLMGAEDLAVLGSRLEDALKVAVQACRVPNEVTRLRRS